MALAHEELTGSVIGAAISVHKALGPAFLESVYGGGLIVVELKAIKPLEDVHFVVVRSYLRAIGREHGLILNFAKPRLETKQVIAPERPKQDLLASCLP